MIEMEDAVQPSQEVIQSMQAKSFATWSRNCQTMELPELSLDCVQPRRMLGRVPAYLAHGKNDKAILSLQCAELQDGSSTLFISGCFKWQTSEDDCNLERRVMQHQLLLGVQRSTTCIFTDDSRFRCWLGVQDTEDNVEKSNYLALLFFVWAYILSVTWLEMQTNDTTSKLLQDGLVRYLNRQTPELDGSDAAFQDDFEINLNNAKDDEARW